MLVVAELDGGDFIAEIPTGSGRYLRYNRERSGKVRYLSNVTREEIQKILGK